MSTLINHRSHRNRASQPEATAQFQRSAPFAKPEFPEKESSEPVLRSHWREAEKAVAEKKAAAESRRQQEEAARRAAVEAEKVRFAHD